MAINILINKGIELTKGETLVLNTLKKIYKDIGYEVYIYVQAKVGNKRPDFIIMDEKKGICIIEVKDWSESYIQEVSKTKVYLVDRESENPTKQIKGYKNLLHAVLVTRDIDFIDEEEISMRVIFTNLDQLSPSNEKLRLLIGSEVGYIFKNHLSHLTISNLFNHEEIEEKLKLTDLNKIRVALFPEIEIMRLEKSKTNQDIKALDFEQEEFAKRIPFGHYMVTGVPGSGKSVILLARAVYLIKENPDWKILILTYNKSLSHKLNSQLNQMAKNLKETGINELNLDNITIKNFHSEVSQLTGYHKKPQEMDNVTWFRDESVRLASQRAKPTYDAILIDEYQDFYLNWISFCLKLCKEHSVEGNEKKVKNIFLAGDRLQSIYNSHEISWKAIGINMQGRSKFLKTSYRSARQHLSLALMFLRNDDRLKKEVNNFYIDELNNHDLTAVNDGSVEFLTGNLEMIGDKICELKKQGYKNEDFLILCPTKSYCYSVKTKSANEIKYEMDYIKDIESDNQNIILTTYHSSKGLEAKVVFLTGIDKIYVGEDMNDQIKRKLLYVGMTRASEKLYIHSTSSDQGKYLTELKKLIKGKNL